MSKFGIRVNIITREDAEEHREGSFWWLEGKRLKDLSSNNYDFDRMSWSTFMYELLPCLFLPAKHAGKWEPQIDVLTYPNCYYKHTDTNSIAYAEVYDEEGLVVPNYGYWTKPETSKKVSVFTKNGTHRYDDMSSAIRALVHAISLHARGYQVNY
jgi:hypothetical protein